MIRLTDMHQLNIGDIMVAADPTVFSVSLTSGVAVCLYSPRRKMGGIVCYAKAKNDGNTDIGRYGDTAIPTLIKKLSSLTGEQSKALVAKIIGGCSKIVAGKDIGMENVKMAESILQKYSIPVIGKNVGGVEGRKVLFHAGSNRLQMKKFQDATLQKAIPKSTNEVATAKSSDGKRKVLIVDDSKTIRELLKRILLQDPQFEIVGQACNVDEAEEILSKVTPDVITLDIQMPGRTGVEWLETLLPATPFPVVMISSLQYQEGGEVFRALELGAIDYIQKPTLSELDEVGPLIIEKVKAASFAKVRTKSPRFFTDNMENFSGTLDTRKILTIGSSTGGTEALKVVLSKLPERIPPTIIVQHIPAVFSNAFARRINEICPFEVKEAANGDVLKPSKVLIAPGGKQMKIVRANANGDFIIKITDDPPVRRHKPSVDYLFHSVAAEAGKSSVGVILTGMGDDGAAGLLAMRQSGARTLTQDEESSVVYGMPKAAFENGGSEKAVPLDKMAKEILNLLTIHSTIKKVG